MNYFLKTILILVILLSFGSCRKSSNNGVPYVNVNIKVYTTDPAFFNLSVVGGWEYISGGSKGILVYRSSSDEFMAYDRHCPYQSEESCSKVFVDISNIMAVDTCCGSEFLITNGEVSSGPSSQPLKQYNTSFDGSVLVITN